MGDKKLPSAVYVDRETRRKDLHALIGTLEDSVRSVSMLHTMKPLPIEIDGRPARVITTMGIGDTHKPFYRLRDSVFFRAASLHFHVTELEDRFLKYEKAVKQWPRLPKHMDHQTWSTEIMSSAQLECTYLLEDIIFHLISFYDYVGRICIFILQYDADKTANWNSAVAYCYQANSAPNKQGYRIIDAHIADRIQRHHREFVDKLAGIRADIYHRQMEFGGVGQTLSIHDPAKSELKVKTPATLARWIRRSLQASGDPDNIVDSAYTIVLEGLHRAIDILSHLSQDVDTKNQRESPIRFIRRPDKSSGPSS